MVIRSHALDLPLEDVDGIKDPEFLMSLLLPFYLVCIPMVLIQVGKLHCYV